MIDNVLRIRMGQRFHPNPTIRGSKIATAALLIIQHADLSISYGIGILYPDTHHLYFAELKTKDLQTICHSLYAASKMHFLCDNAIKKICAIADKSVTLDDPHEDIGYIMYGHTAESLRKKILSRKIEDDDIQKIIKRFQVWNLEIHDPNAKKSVPRESVPRTFSRTRIHPANEQLLGTLATA